MFQINRWYIKTTQQRDKTRTTCRATTQTWTLQGTSALWSSHSFKRLFGKATFTRFGTMSAAAGHIIRLETLAEAVKDKNKKTKKQKKENSRRWGV